MKQTMTLPSCWATDLFYNSTANIICAIDDREDDQIRDLLERHGNAVDMSEPWVGRFNGLICEVAEYTWLR